MPEPPIDYTPWIIGGSIVLGVIVLLLIIRGLVRGIARRRRIASENRAALLRRAEQQNNEISHGNLDAIFGDYRPVDIEWKS